MSANDQGSAIFVVANENTDASGGVDLQLLAGREYRIIATTPDMRQGDPVDPNIPPENLLRQTQYVATGGGNGSMPAAAASPIVTEQEQPVCAGPVEFIAKDGMTLNLTPGRSWDECRSAPKPALTQ